MRPSVVVPLLGVLLANCGGLDSVEAFIPFEPRAYRLVNSIAFGPDDQSMYLALFYRDVLTHRGRPDSTASELGLFVSLRRGHTWAEPQLLSFSGVHPDYEPALSPDGSLLIFNSKRPYDDGRTPAVNDLWMVERNAGWQETCDLYIAFRRGSDWTDPVALTELNSATPDYAAALSSDGQWLYYRAGGQFVRRPLAGVLAAPRERVE